MKLVIRSAIDASQEGANRVATILCGGRELGHTLCLNAFRRIAMGIRETIDRHKPIAIGITLVLLLGAGSLIYVNGQSDTSGPASGPQSFFSDDDGKHDPLRAPMLRRRSSARRGRIPTSSCEQRHPREVIGESGSEPGSSPPVGQESGQSGTMLPAILTL